MGFLCHKTIIAVINAHFQCCPEQAWVCECQHLSIIASSPALPRLLHCRIKALRPGWFVTSDKHGHHFLATKGHVDKPKLYVAYNPKLQCKAWGCLGMKLPVYCDTLSINGCLNSMSRNPMSQVPPPTHTHPKQILWMKACLQAAKHEQIHQ